MTRIDLDDLLAARERDARSQGRALRQEEPLLDELPLDPSTLVLVGLWLVLSLLIVLKLLMAIGTFIALVWREARATRGPAKPKPKPRAKPRPRTRRAWYR